MFYMEDPSSRQRQEERELHQYKGKICWSKGDILRPLPHPP